MRAKNSRGLRTQYGFLHGSRRANRGQHVSRYRYLHAVYRFLLSPPCTKAIYGQTMIVFLGAISQRWNDGNRIFGMVTGAIHKMAGRRNGKDGEWIDIGNVVKQFAKLHTTPTV